MRVLVARAPQEISPLNIKELQTVHTMRAKAEEAAHPQLFTPKGKTASRPDGAARRKRPLPPGAGTGKENAPAAKVRRGGVTSGGVGWVV